MSASIRPVGLALGGGAALGLAHVPILRALDDLGIRPALIAGTSMGAIIGAFYAAGHSGEEIEKFVLGIRRSKRDLLRRLWLSRPRAIGNLFGPQRTTAAQLAAQDVLKAFGDLLPGSFDQLQIPLKVIATDYYAAREVVLTEGPLVPAVAASMALPFLFRPVMIDGRPLVDGGLVDPLPFEHARLPGGIVIAVDVLPGPRGAAPRIPRRIETAIGSAQIQMKVLTREKLRRLGEPELLIEPMLRDFEPLEFTRAEEIFAAANAAADRVRADLPGLLGDRTLPPGAAVPTPS